MDECNLFTQYINTIHTVYPYNIWMNAILLIQYIHTIYPCNIFMQYIYAINSSG